MKSREELVTCRMCFAFCTQILARKVCSYAIFAEPCNRGCRPPTDRTKQMFQVLLCASGPFMLKQQLHTPRDNGGAAAFQEESLTTVQCLMCTMQDATCYNPIEA